MLGEKKISFAIDLCCSVYVSVGEKEAEDKDLNSEAPSSVSEATSEKESNSVSQSNAVSSRKDDEQSNSIKKVGLSVDLLLKH